MTEDQEWTAWYDRLIAEYGYDSFPVFEWEVLAIHEELESAGLL